MNGTLETATTGPGHHRASPRGLLVAMVLALVLPNGTVAAQGADPSPAAAPATSTAPPSPRPESWQPVEVAPLAPVARLTPSASSAAGIPVDATFTLTSLTETPATSLAAGLTVEPAMDLRVEPGPIPSRVVLRPTEALEPGAQVRFALRGADGSTLGSWVFRTRAPLQIVETLPRDQATGVPTDTGVEITFDRDGVLAPERSFSIEPAVTGRFERAGRTLAFIPDRPLQSSTIYTVRLRPGIEVVGSDESLQEGLTFAFQTRAPREQERDWVQFANQVVESAPDTRPILEVYIYRHPSDRLAVEIHRFPSLDAVVRALRDLQTGPDWAEWSAPLLSTEGLDPVGTVQGRLQRLDRFDSADRVLTLPEPLPAGWYLLSVADDTSPAQLILQVTDLAAYAHLTWTDSLVWVNSVASGLPVSGAAVSIVDGPALGTTDDEGVLVVPTGPRLKSDDPAPVLLVQGPRSAVLVPFGTSRAWASSGKDVAWRMPEMGDRYWTFFYTDRDAYRTTDSINAWGMLRARGDGSVPGAVELRLVADDEDYWDDDRGPAIVRTTVGPASTGVFSGSLAFERLPLGSYVLEVWVDGERAARAWIELRDIVKPAYRLALSSPRRAYVDGEAIPVSIVATFFDGTQVPAARLSVSSTHARRSLVTDGLGRAGARVLARSDPHWGQVQLQEILARPRQSEEGEITAGTRVAVVSSSRYLTADATLARGRVRVAGAVNAVDLARLERQVAEDIDGRLDPRGRAVPGARVRATVVEVVTTRHQVGTRYDFLTKQVVPEYEWRERSIARGSRVLAAGTAGRFSFDVPGRPDSSYYVELSTTDEAGRTARLRVYADRPVRDDLGGRPYLAPAGSADADPHGVASVGDRVAVELRQGTRPQPQGGHDRYIFLVQRTGLRRAVVQRSPVFSFRFREADVPMLEIGAVRFTGSTYVAVPDGFSVRLEEQDRRLGIQLTTDQARYEPGGHVDLTVRTTDRTGRPTPASVVLRAVDEKLYAMGLAHGASPLGDLYAPIWSGTLRTYASHPLPIGSPRGEGADTGGGGEGARSDFRDVLLFRQVETGADGRARVRLDLSDDLTSWRIAATAVSPDLEAGEATTLVPVGLPFFVELVSAPEYLTADDVRLRLRAYGPALRRGDAVTYTVSAPSLDMPATSVRGAAFEVADVALPDLVEGRHAVTVEATAEVDGVQLRDALVRTIPVVPSRLERSMAAYAPLVAGTPLGGGEGLTRVVISDAGRGRFYPELVDLATSSGPRADQALAAAEARLLLTQWFDGADAELPGVAFDRTQFQRGDGSIALLPYSSASDDVSFLVALAAPEAVDADALGDWFRGSHWRRNVTRERALLAIAARSALGEDTLEELDAISPEGTLSTSERLLLGLGLSAAGDTERALAIERELLGQHGQQLGAWVRLWDDTPGEILSARDTRERSAVLTALLAILAADVGDEATATAADAYVRYDPPSATLASLQHLAVIDRLIARTVASPASFAWELDGEGGTVELAPGESHPLTLTAAQRMAIRLAPLSGSLGVATSWDEPLAASAPSQDETIRVTRSVLPEGAICAADTVEVTIAVDLGPAALTGCYLVTDMVPSGLAPIRETAGWPRRSATLDVDSPLSIAGQRVTFCAYREPDDPAVEARGSHLLRYEARMITPGTYAWEPTLVQAAEAPESWRLGEASRITLGAGTVVAVASPVPAVTSLAVASPGAVASPAPAGARASPPPSVAVASAAP
jgi:alpha-2-macroglobulin